MSMSILAIAVAGKWTLTNISNGQPTGDVWTFDSKTNQCRIDGYTVSYRVHGSEMEFTFTRTDACKMKDVWLERLLELRCPFLIRQDRERKYMQLIHMGTPLRPNIHMPMIEPFIATFARVIE